MKRDRTWMIAALLVALLPARGHADDEDRFRVWGDFRGRYEGFWFRQDETGVEKAQHRSRLRYRLRLNGYAKINPHAGFEMQIGSGGTDNRSGNQTLGSPVDFGPNALDIRRAYFIVNPYADGKLGSREGSWTFHFGRVPNLFTWKHGKDMMLWDSDINFGGLSTAFDTKLAPSTMVLAHAGYYVIDENGSKKDAYMAAGQVGLQQGVGENADVGVRGTYYHFDYLDADFIQRGVDGKNVDGSKGVTSGGGNFPDGLTGDPNGGKLQVVEAQAYVKAKPAALTLFGGYSNNLSAEKTASVPQIGKQNQAFNAGVQVGSSKKSIGQVGVMYIWIEADAFPSQFIDSDFLDGYTNRKGGMLYYARNIVKNVDFNFQSLLSADIEPDVPNPDISVENSKRWRNQVDFIYKF